MLQRRLANAGAHVFVLTSRTAVTRLRTARRLIVRDQDGRTLARRRCAEVCAGVGVSGDLRRVTWSEHGESGLRARVLDRRSGRITTHTITGTKPDPHDGSLVGRLRVRSVGDLLITSDLRADHGRWRIRYRELGSER